jgi:hypothetical protein
MWLMNRSVLHMIYVQKFVMDSRPVVDRQLHTFLCFAKEKYAKERRPHSLPLRGSRLCGAENGKASKLSSLRFASLRSNTTLSDPFSAPQKRQRLQRIKINDTNQQAYVFA